MCCLIAVGFDTALEKWGCTILHDFARFCTILHFQRTRSCRKIVCMRATYVWQRDRAWHNSRVLPPTLYFVIRGLMAYLKKFVTFKVFLRAIMVWQHHIRAVSGSTTLCYDPPTGSSVMVDMFWDEIYNNTFFQPTKHIQRVSTSVNITFAVISADVR